MFLAALPFTARAGDLRRRHFACTAVLAALAFVALTAGANAQGASAGIEGTAWRVEDISGQGVIDRAQTTISFDAPGRVSGSTGCNRYTGVATLEGEALRFGQLAVTKRACVPALMDQEQKFLRAMAAVRGYAVATNGWLQLRGASGEPLLRGVAMPKDAPDKSGPTTPVAGESTRVTGTVSYRERIALAVRKPRRSRQPTSPVRSQPRCTTAAVASGLRQ